MALATRILTLFGRHLQQQQQSVQLVHHTARGLTTAANHNMASAVAADAAVDTMTWATLSVSRPREHVVHVQLNRPEKRNALNLAMWEELRVCFDTLSVDADCRAVVLSGAGKIFTSGIDLAALMSVGSEIQRSDAARTALALRPTITRLQDSFTAMERCPKPVICAVHSACIGGGVDMITACDIRMCSNDAFFQVKEVDLGLAADVGTLQRLPKVLGNDSLVRELCFSARRMYAGEALQAGLVSRVFESREELLEACLRLASQIASKSPVAVAGTKHLLNYSRDHTVADGLAYVAVWNSMMLQTEDVARAAQASVTKQTAVYSKL